MLIFGKVIKNIYLCIVIQKRPSDDGFFKNENCVRTHPIDARQD